MFLFYLCRHSSETICFVQFYLWHPAWGAVGFVVSFNKFVYLRLFLSTEISFERKDFTGKGIGVIAQEIEQVLPEVVVDGEYKSVSYGNIVGLLIEAIKELEKKHKHGL